MPSASMHIQIGMMCPPQRANTRSTPRALRNRAIRAAAEFAERETAFIAGSAGPQADSEYRLFAIGTPKSLEFLDDVAHRGAGGDQLDRHRHDVFALVLRDRDELVEQRRHLGAVALASYAVQARDLALGRRRIMRVQLDVEFLLGIDVFVDT